MSKHCALKLLAISMLTFSRFGAMASISSINMIAGEFFSASSNAGKYYKDVLQSVWW